MKSQTECWLVRFLSPIACIIDSDEGKDNGGQLGADWRGQFSVDSPSNINTFNIHIHLEVQYPYQWFQVSTNNTKPVLGQKWPH